MSFPVAVSPMAKTDDRIKTALANTQYFWESFAQVADAAEALDSIYLDYIPFDIAQNEFGHPIPVRNNTELEALQDKRPFCCVGTDYPNSMEIVRDSSTGFVIRHQTKIYFEIDTFATGDPGRRTLRTYAPEIEIDSEAEVIRAWKNLAPQILWDFAMLPDNDLRVDVTRITGIDCYRMAEDMRDSLGDCCGCYATLIIGPEA